MSSNRIRMPGMPASPKNSAYSDQTNAASTPRLIRVSMVAAPWRALTTAARWNGQAPHTTTGAARVSESHCQLGNCRPGIMAIASTGAVSPAEIIRRWRNERTSTSSGSSTPSPVASSAETAGGRGRRAV